MRTIPIRPSVGDQSFRVPLESGVFQFRIRFNRFEGTWFMDITSPGGQTVQGVAMVLGTELVRKYRIGLGALFVVDLGRTGAEATFEALGDRVVLVHMTESEYDSAIQT